MTSKAKILSALLTVVGSIIFSLLLLEIGLRFLPVNEPLRTMPVNAASPIIRAEPNRTITWSRFADFSMVNTVRINNYGFINDQDYDSKGNGPLVAVIGDSYMEALMVPYEQTAAARLAARLDTARVYTFAASGAPLSQYLAYARWAKDEFCPSKLIIAIISNDFSESLLKYKSSGGMHYFKEDGGSLKLVRKDLEPSFLVRLASRSKLIMYLMTNIQIQNALNWRILDSAKQLEREYIGQVQATASKGMINDSIKGITAFLAQLPEMSGMTPDDICFVVDGIRPNLYSPGELAKAESSYFAIMRKDFMNKARSLGYHVVDMQPVFMEEHTRSGTRFEFEKDSHWNGAGHEMMYKAIIDSGFLKPLETPDNQ